MAMPSQWFTCLLASHIPGYAYVQIKTTTKWFATDYNLSLDGHAF